MKAIVEFAISRARLTLAVLAFLLLAGWSAYQSIPKEAEPDVRVPIIYVNVTQRGISPEDAERLILRPLETQLKSARSIKEMRSPVLIQRQPWLMCAPKSMTPNVICRGLLMSQK
jgi:multidrug efflux pump subunit AcrB